MMYVSNIFMTGPFPVKYDMCVYCIYVWCVYSIHVIIIFHPRLIQKLIQLLFLNFFFTNIYTQNENTVNTQ